MTSPRWRHLPSAGAGRARRHLLRRSWERLPPRGNRHGQRGVPKGADEVGVEGVRYETRGRVAIVTIDRPHVRNAVDQPTATALSDAFATFDADPDLHVAILTGGDRHFCAGADLQALADGEEGRVSPEGIGPMGPTRMRLSKPVIAAVEGFAVAGGLELAIWCDLRIAGNGAVFGVFCRRFGVPLVDLGTVRLP